MYGKTGGEGVSSPGLPNIFPVIQRTPNQLSLSEPRAVGDLAFFQLLVSLLVLLQNGKKVSAAVRSA